jgi:hypothetical protein
MERNNYLGKVKTLEQECRIEPCTFDITKWEPQNYAGSYIEGGRVSTIN